MFNIFNKKETSAGHAKERLQLMISTQRIAIGDERAGPSLIDPKTYYKIQAEIMIVLEKYVVMNREDVKMEVKEVSGNHRLEVSVPILDEKVSV